MAGFVHNILGRLGLRHEPPLDVHFRTELDFVKEHAYNLCNGRMFIRTKRKPPVYSVTRVEVILPTAQVLRGTARVVPAKGKAAERGIFVEFLRHDPALPRALDRYLVSLA